MAKRKISVLNVGYGGHHVPFDGIEEVTLDVNPSVKPDIVGDARQLERIVAAGRFDGVYCSHVLEHFYEHEVPVVLRGILYVLKSNGVLFLAVPDLAQVFAALSARKQNVGDVIFQSEAGPIRALDVLYGLQAEVTSGNGFYAHKTGFDRETIVRAITQAGFPKGYAVPGDFQINVIACKGKMPRWVSKYVKVSDGKA